MDVTVPGDAVQIDETPNAVFETDPDELDDNEQPEYSDTLDEWVFFKFGSPVTLDFADDDVGNSVFVTARYFVAVNEMDVERDQQKRMLEARMKQEEREQEAGDEEDVEPVSETEVPDMANGVTIFASDEDGRFGQPVLSINKTFFSDELVEAGAEQPDEDDPTIQEALDDFADTFLTTNESVEDDEQEVTGIGGV